MCTKMSQKKQSDFKYKKVTWAAALKHSLIYHQVVPLHNCVPVAPGRRGQGGALPTFKGAESARHRQ